MGWFKKTPPPPLPPPPPPPPHAAPRTRLPTRYDPSRLDVRLLQTGAVALYYKPSVLSRDVEWLSSAGYRVVTLDAAGWRSVADFHQAARGAFAFPSHYAGNFAAWVDALGEIEIATDGGVVVQLRRFDQLVRLDARFAQLLLDSFESAARRAIVTDQRLLALVQSDDPRIRFERVGAMPVNWNPREWQESDRGLRPAS